MADVVATAVRKALVAWVVIYAGVDNGDCNAFAFCNVFAFYDAWDVQHNVFHAQQLYLFAQKQVNLKTQTMQLKKRSFSYCFLSS
jgi:hypothetical protein